MTTHIINISTSYNGEFNRFTTSQPSDTQAVQGDSIQFKWGLHDGQNEPGHIAVTGLDSSVFTDASGFNLFSPGSSQTRVIKNNAALILDQIVFTPSDSRYDAKTANLIVASSLDQDPQQFNLGDDVINVNPLQVVEGREFTISQLSTNANAPVSITGGQWSKNGGSFTSANGVVNNGDRVQTRVTASSNFSTEVVCELTIGSVTDAWSVSTRFDPGEGQKIPFGFNSESQGVDLFDDIAQFFGFRYNETPFGATLANYVRGGDFVPNIPENSGVPAFPPVEIDDLRGAYHSLYWEKLPDFKAIGYNADSNATLTLGWSTIEQDINSSDFYVGYGDGMRNVVEYRYLLPNKPSQVTVTTPNYGTWSHTNKIIALEYQVSAGENEADYQGTITIQVRHPANPSLVLETEVFYRFSIYGD